MDNKEGSRSSTETSTMDEEKQILLESSETLEQTTFRSKHSPFRKTRVAILLLVLSNIAFVAALGLVLRSQSSSSLPTWMPPERTAKKLFMYQSVFGGEPDAKSEEMWTKLIPMGKGWINVTADTDEIPYYPGMDRDYEALYIYAEQHRSSDKKVIHE
ncbi:hypothetical protein K4K61_005009 [Colletotrichum sp. SAR11_59]|nr:hypothetical protein K4K61_005009 [Colletotrichum sp. SAR11_59]